VQQLAEQQGASLADTVAVCGAVHMQQLVARAQQAAATTAASAAAAATSSSEDRDNVLLSGALRLGRQDVNQPHSLQFGALWAQLNMVPAGHEALPALFARLANEYAAFVRYAPGQQLALSHQLLQLQQQVAASRRLRQVGASPEEVLTVMAAAAPLAPRASPGEPRPAAHLPSWPRPGAPHTLLTCAGVTGSTWEGGGVSAPERPPHPPPPQLTPQ